MALVNPNIAMSYRGVEVPQQNMLADYAAIQQIQGGQQAQQLNALKMQEYERARTEEEGLRNYLAKADLANPETRAGLARYGKTGLAYGKALTEQDTAALTQREAAFKVQDAKGKFIAQAKRDTSNNPSDANLTAFKEDLLANPLFTEPEKLQLGANIDRILAMPVDQRRSFMASQGASANELKPVLTPQNLGGTARILSTPAFGGAATQVVGSEGTVTAAPPAPTDIAKLIRERDALPLNSPNRALYDKEIANRSAVAENARKRLEFDKYKFNWEKANPGMELREDENGDLYGINKNTLQVVPVNIGGPAPAAAPAAGGTGMPSARVPAPQAPLAGATPTAVKQFRGKGQGMTEGERKASTLLQRLQFSEGQLTKALVDDPDAAKPGVFTSALDVLSTPLANTLTPEARQRVQSAQLDILDAALTLGTGAAYTKEQLEGYRSSYFPAIGDGPTQVKDKKARLQNVISAAKIAAGKGAKLIPDTSSGANANDPLGLLKGN